MITFGSSGLNTSLSPGAFDLAEWVSLMPAAQLETPALTTAFLLRLPLACLGLVAAFTIPRRLIAAPLALAVAVALLPPLEFLYDAGNLNYRQQVVLSMLTFVGGLVAASSIFRRYHHWFAIVISLAGMMATIIGLTRAYDLMQSFDLVATLGLGGVLSGGIFGMVALLLLVRQE